MTNGFRNQGPGLGQAQKCGWLKPFNGYGCVYLYITLIFLPPIITPFICSNDSCAASGMSYSMKANPLCLFVKGSHDKLTDFIGPNGKNACLIVSSLISKLILPTYILKVNA